MSETGGKTPPAAGARRLRQLDVLRGVAVLLVLGRHHEITAVWTQIGWIGVDLFFVLSGFLISGLLFTEFQRSGNLDVKRFLIRRGMKIYPPFWVLTAATAIVGVTRGEFKPAAFIREVLFLQNFRWGLWAHTWSLAVEEHFYLGLPILMLLLMRRNRAVAHSFGGIPRLSLLIGLSLLMLRLILAEVFQYSEYIHVYPTFVRADSLMAGVALAYCHHYQRERLCGLVGRNSAAILLGSLALISCAFFWRIEELPMYTVGFSMLSVGFTGILALVLYSKLTHSRLAALSPIVSPLAFVGFYSYSIYLWHIPVENWLMPLLKPEATVASLRHVIYFGASVGYGVLMAKLVEIPTLKLRDRWFPQSGVASPPHAEAARPREDGPVTSPALV
jgi:peptidoglycan/LPS O-acetylase OafA/YrhL